MAQKFNLKLPDLIIFVKESCHFNLHQTLHELYGLSDELLVLERNNPEFPTDLPVFIKNFICNTRNHLDLEEINLYPIFEEDTSVSHCSIIEIFENDHEKIQLDLLVIRNMTQNYYVPDEATIKFSTYYKSLKEMDRILQNHILIENQVLFPMARKIA